MRFGEAILHAGAGKFDDVNQFAHGRIREILLIATVGVGLSLLYSLLLGLLAKVRSRAIRVFAGGVIAFVGVNAMLMTCDSTVCYWMALYSPVHIDNFVQFEIKRGLFDEFEGRQRLLIMGNSQANRCIDEIVLNDRFGSSIWSTDFTQPGARGFDLLVAKRELDLRRSDLVILFVSEISFYGGGSGIVVSNFLHFEDLRDLQELEGWQEQQPGSLRKGLLGRMIPCYRHSEPLSWRVFGGELLGLKQTEWDENRNDHASQQAVRHHGGFAIDAGARFQWAAFLRLVSELVAQGCQILVLEGDLHPTLREQIPGEIHDHMVRELSSLGTQYGAQVTLLQGSMLLDPEPFHFKDLVHFSDQAQKEHSEARVDYLEDWLPQTEVATGK